jgi:quinol monooxygenase YgiN
MAVAPLPFVSYSSLTEVVAAADEWEALYASLQTLKGHVQEYPGCQRFDVFIRAEDAGEVRIHCYTTWDTPWQLEAFLERGYTLERLLADLGDLSAERSLVMEKVF